MNNTVRLLAALFPQAQCGVSSAQQLVSHALLRWRQRMLRADNTSAIVISLQEPGGPPGPLHHEEVLLNLADGPHCAPMSGSRSNTPLIKASAAGTWWWVGTVAASSERAGTCPARGPLGSKALHQIVTIRASLTLNVT